MAVAWTLLAFDAASTHLIVDYSALAKPDVALTFTPFGLLRVDDHRLVYRLIPLRGKCGDLRFAEDSARPMMVDESLRQLHVQLTGRPEEAGLRLGQPIAMEKLALPGLSLENVKGTFTREGSALVLRLTD